jgi:hypothetical protein
MLSTVLVSPPIAVPVAASHLLGSIIHTQCVVIMVLGARV